MNRLAETKRALILKCLTEGMGINATARIVGCSKNTVLKLLRDVGAACSDHQDQTFRNLNCQHLQVDETWTFIHSRKRTASRDQTDAGDVWTWIAICENSKIIPSWMIGDRTYETGYDFMLDLSTRMSSEVQISTDGLTVYESLIEDTFGERADHRILKRLYPSKGRRSVGRTSYIERQNLTLRMANRRYARNTNAHSKKLANHGHSLAIHFMVYNFCRPHESLGRGITPAMAEGLADQRWPIEALLNLAPIADPN